MDFPSDSVLMSHTGEGNWKFALTERPVSLIKRPLGIGGLDDPPTILFQYQPGPATLASLVSLEGERFGWWSPKARTSTARNYQPWRCPMASSGHLRGCAHV